MEKAALHTVKDGRIVLTAEHLSKQNEARAVAAVILAKHEQNETHFKQLLEQEQSAPDQARWSTIRPLLEYVGAYLSVDPTLRNKLLDIISPTIDEDARTIEEHDITYEQWRALVNPHVVQEVAPPLPPLPPLMPEGAKNNLPQREQSSNDQDESPIVANPAQEAPALTQTKPTSAVQQSASTVTKKKKKKKKKKKDPNILFEDALKAKNLTQALALLKTHRGKINVNECIEGVFPVQIAVLFDDAALLQELLEQGASSKIVSLLVPQKTNTLMITTALLPTLLKGQLECARLLLEAGANPNICITSQTNQDVEHPLCLAASAGDEHYTMATRISMIALLLSHGAQASCDRLKILFRHPKFGWVVNLKDPRNDNLISDYMKCTAKLSLGGSSIITLVANPELLQSSPVHRSLKSLLGASMRERDLAQEFAYIVNQNYFDKAQQFLAEHHQSFDMNTPSAYYDDLPPLYYAILMDSEPLCNILLKYGASPNHIVTLGKTAKDTCQVTPLFYAIAGAKKARLCQLLEHGADPNQVVHSYPKITQSPLDLMIAQKTDPLFPDETRNDLIRILLLKDATVCSKEIFILNQATQKSCRIDLKKKDDQERVKSIVLRDTDGTSIMCKNNTLILIEK